MWAVLVAIAIAGATLPSLGQAARPCRILSATGSAHGDTCTPLTEQLLINLKFATKHQVQAAFSGPGARLIDGMHYKSVYTSAGSYSGVVNFGFENGRVVLITALLKPSNTDENDGQDLMYIWSSNPEKSSCSDFEGSTQRCTFPG